MSHYTGDHRPLPDGRCEHRWANRQTKAVHCSYPDGWNEGRARGDAQASLARLELEEFKGAFRHYCITLWRLETGAATKGDVESAYGRLLDMAYVVQGEAGE